MTAQTQHSVVKRDYKSRMFTMIFSDKKELLKLYNAVGNRNYDDSELLTINTLENAIYMSMHNDLSFIIDSRMYLYEHQSTFNPNMPLRFLFYLKDLLSDMVKGKNIYGTKQIQLPTPAFIVFYNGIDKQPDHRILRLSDAYLVKEEEVSLDLKVDMFNINRGHNQELLDACKTLKDYAEYTYRVRKYAKEVPIEEAVERAINECIQEDILREFLERNRAEAKSMSIYEYDEEEHMRMEREDAFEDGRKAEQVNTERERQRADEAEKRTREVEADNVRLREELTKLQSILKEYQ